VTCRIWGRNHKNSPSGKSRVRVLFDGRMCLRVTVRGRADKGQSQRHEQERIVRSMATDPAQSVGSRLQVQQVNC